MQSAKEAVQSFIGKSGQHDTTVDETVNPAVTREAVKPHRHEETTEAVDREVHQHHYHTTVQPVEHQEQLPEQHIHQQLPTQEKEFVHGDDTGTRRAVDAEAAQFADSSTTHETTHSQAAAPSLAGEHVHHHVHETVQPVIHKSTVQPEVVHTTIPIHERHQAPSEHHGMSTLPMKSLNEFTSAGGEITGAGHRHEEYEGHPRAYNPQMQVERAAIDKDPIAHDGVHDLSASGHSGSTGAAGSAAAIGGVGSHQAVGSGIPSSTSHGTGIESERGLGSSTTDTGLGSSHHESSGTGPSEIAQQAESGVGHSSGIEASRGTTDSGADTSKAEHGHDSSRNHGSSEVRDDVQSPKQGEDPSLIGSGKTKMTGDGVDGSHSAVFGLTPDGHISKDTSHGSGKLEPAHSSSVSNSNSAPASGDTVPGGKGGVADQMHDPSQNKGLMTGDDSTKPGAGMTGGEQGLGEVRPGEHGGESKMQSKVDPTTDADGDGKRGVMD